MAFLPRSEVAQRDFTGDVMVRNPPVDVGDMGSFPGLGRFHMPWGNWDHATTTKPMLSRACTPQQKKPLQWEVPALQLESSPHSPQLEKACAKQQRPSAATNNK